MYSKRNVTDCSDKAAFSLWQAKALCAEEEEQLNKRRSELQRLVRKVIKNELSEFDQRLVELHWYKGLSKTQTAEILGVDRSTVHRHFTGINETVYEKLKYAVELIYGKEHKAEEILKENNETFSSHINSDEISKRLKALRAQGCYTTDFLSSKTGISQLRIKELEKRGIKMTMSELKKITDFFNVSTDYIIFGITGKEQ